MIEEAPENIDSILKPKNIDLSLISFGINEPFYTFSYN